MILDLTDSANKKDLLYEPSEVYKLKRDIYEQNRKMMKESMPSASVLKDIQH